jgi:hypothetical protein
MIRVSLVVRSTRANRGSVMAAASLAWRAL